LIAALEVPLTIQVASIGIPDTLFLMLLALVVFGPRRLPEIGRQIGKLMYEFRKVSNDFKFQMEEELRASEEADRQRKLQAATAQEALDAPKPLPEPEPAAQLEPGAGTTVIDPTYAAALEAENAAKVADDKASAEGIAPAVAGEVRGEPRRFPHIQPPVTGETIAAQKPFRGRVEEAPQETGEAPKEPAQTEEVPAIVDSSGVNAATEQRMEEGTEQEARHA
jgi:sec-independent protein translocase protein TatB